MELIVRRLKPVKSAQKTLAENLKRLREAAGFTQASLSEAIEVSLRGYQKYEQGVVWPEPNKLDKIAKTLGIPLTDLFGVNEGGKMPASVLHLKGGKAAYDQVVKGKRNKAEAQMLSARGKPAKAMTYPEDLAAGLEFVSKFADQERDIQLTAMALVYENVDYLSQLSPEFRAQLVQLLLTAKI